MTKYRVLAIVEQTRGMFAGANTEHDLGWFEAESKADAIKNAEEKLKQYNVIIKQISVFEVSPD